MSAQKGWIKEAAEEINAVDCKCFCVTLDADMAADIISRHCPFKPDTAYVPIAPTGNLGQDMVDALDAEDYRKACMLAVTKNNELYLENNAYAKNNAALKGLLHETYRDHARDCLTLSDGPCDCGSPTCPINAANDKACSCGASAWNARVDEALRG